MRRSGTLIILCAAVLLLNTAGFAADELEQKKELDAQRFAELDKYWAEVSRSVREGDFEGYKATCHSEGVLVAGTRKNSQPLSVALARWEADFIATKSGKIKANVEFRFSLKGCSSNAKGIGRFSWSIRNQKLSSKIGRG
jgi:hypothetical protein